MKETPGLYTQIKTLELGASVTVPVDGYSYNTVRRYASDFGLTLNRKYTCHLNRLARTFTITRLS